MYVVGGCDENNFRLNSVERYSFVINIWLFIVFMIICRSSLCVLICRVLYVIGGVSYVGMLFNIGEYLDSLINTWRVIVLMYDKRVSVFGVVINGKIYVIGKYLVLRIKK